LSFLLKWSGILCVPGGLLWALSPTGVSISTLAFHTPNVFWKMFWPAPLLILLGLIGLQLRQSARSGLLEKVGFFVTIVGLVMVIAGDVGLYWLGVDDIFIVTAPAYNAFRIGLLVFGAILWILFGVGWAWLGLSFVVEGFSSFLRTRRAACDGIAVKH
jgi:hypothetical protein